MSYRKNSSDSIDSRSHSIDSRSHSIDSRSHSIDSDSPINTPEYDIKENKYAVKPKNITITPRRREREQNLNNIMSQSPNIDSFIAKLYFANLNEFKKFTENISKK